ncbi:MAG: hypothetical protein [Cressdnaviricota sp.]|nr:MAG: hypothetical protein [Cressdnaviricota sp.]
MHQSSSSNTRSSRRTSRPTSSTRRTRSQSAPSTPSTLIRSDHGQQPKRKDTYGYGQPCPTWEKQLISSNMQRHTDAPGITTQRSTRTSNQIHSSSSWMSIPLLI